MISFTVEVEEALPDREPVWIVLREGHDQVTIESCFDALHGRHPDRNYRVCKVSKEELYTSKDIRNEEQAATSQPKTEARA